MSLRDEILAGGFDLANRDDGAIAAALSVGRTKMIETRIGYDTVLATLGATAGAQVLDTLEALAPTVRPVYWAMKLLDAGRLDVANPQTRASIDGLVGAAMTQEQADAIKALAVVPDPVSSADVSHALEGYAP